ncbi:MAG: protein translocase subunit SecF [Candidatus Liptonbacteria bacterium]|nr:protein translocase subunit SecF [Candidatus Liptonbacteria bacterium]
MKIKLVEHRNWFLGAAVVLVGASILAVVVFGFRLGIDFTGGTLWQIKVAQDAPSLGAMEQTFQQELGIKDVRLSADSRDGSFWARFPEQGGESHHQELWNKLQSKYANAEEISFSSIGPSVSADLRNRAVWAIGLVLVGISLYIAYAFRKVSRPVSSWTYGWVTLASLFHDVAIPAGLLAVLGYTGRIEVDTNFVVALLVVMGFSVHDTIVVFDRIRENLFASHGKTNFSEVINASVNQTMARSINTSFTLVLVLVALYLVGPVTLQYFALTLLVGVVAGTYSSIFVASPILYLAGRRK